MATTLNVFSKWVGNASTYIYNKPALSNTYNPQPYDQTPSNFTHNDADCQSNRPDNKDRDRDRINNAYSYRDDFVPNDGERLNW